MLPEAKVGSSHLATAGRQGDPTLKFVQPRTTTPPSGVSVRTESRRTRFNCGAIRFRQLTESASLFESVSILVKGGWKETQGLQRPISAEKPVSESRMASLNPFETERKKAPSGTSSRVCDVQLAEGTGLISNPLHSKSLIYMILTPRARTADPRRSGARAETKPTASPPGG